MPDRHWDWRYNVEVRTAIRPAIATEAQTAAFLIEQGINLTPDANNLFVDAVANSLYSAFVRLEDIARGNYAPDDTLASFPLYEDIAEPARRLGDRFGQAGELEQFRRGIEQIQQQQ